MAVTTWTSEGMDWSSLTGKTLYPYIEAVRLAFVERFKAIGYSPAPSELTRSLTGLPPAYNVAGSSTLGKTIQDYMDAFLGGYGPTTYNFVNHHDNDGSWNGATAGPPVWTEADMLAQIGHASRIRIDNDSSLDVSPITAAWLQQQYLMLNQLRWTRIQQVSAYDVYYSLKDVWEPDWATAVAAFAAEPWSSWNQVGNTIYDYAGHYARYNDGHYTIHRVRLRHTRSTPTTDFNHTMHVYTECVSNGIAGDHYENNDYASADAAGDWALVQEEATPNAAASHVVYIGDFDENSMSQPAADGTRNHWFTPGYDESGVEFGTYVFKWDVTGGFQFVA